MPDNQQNTAQGTRTTYRQLIIGAGVLALTTLSSAGLYQHPEEAPELVSRTPSPASDDPPAMRQPGQVTSAQRPTGGPQAAGAGRQLKPAGRPSAQGGPNSVPAPAPPADARQLEHWLLALSDQQLGPLIATRKLDRWVAQVVAGHEKRSATGRFLTRLNKRILRLK